MNASTAPQHLVPFAGGWEAHRHRHCIWIVSPENYGFERAFDEMADSLEEAFRELGGSAPVVRTPEQWNGRSPIVLGGNILWRVGYPAMPPDTIIFNLEQLVADSVWVNERYFPLLRSFPVVDFSETNLEALRTLGVEHAKLLGIGYSPTLTRIKMSPQKDYDVIFIGSMNERRRHVLEQLAGRGMVVGAIENMYGPERDFHIGRAKLALNLHYYERSAFEEVRVSYLMANRVPVVSEIRADETAPEWAIGGVDFFPYEQLVDRCIALVTDDERRVELAEAGFQAIASRRQSALLWQCIQSAR